MGTLFMPDHQIESIQNFDAAAFAEKGIRMVFSDLDNTLTRWNDQHMPSQTLAFAARLRAHNIDLCLVSNNHATRVKPFAQTLHAQYIVSAAKPLPFKINHFLRTKGLLRRQCLLMGDQLLTDVLAGNLAGMQTLLVSPIDLTHEFKGTKINRFFEKPLYSLLHLKRYDKK